MSLYDLSKDLENVSDQNLMQMAQDPAAMYPQFLVLAEVQRRNQVRQRYETEVAKQQQPQTTVSEEVMMEFAGQSPMPQPESPMQQMAMEEQMPVQQMASGGLTSYQEGGKTALEQSFFENRYTDEDGYDYSQILSDASILIPGFGLLGLAGRGLKGLIASGALKRGADKALPRIKSVLEKTYTKKKPTIQYGKEGKIGDKTIFKGDPKIGPRLIDPKTGATVAPGTRVFDPLRTAAGLGSVPFFATQVAQMGDKDAIPKDKKEPYGIPETGLRKADPLDIAQIGFAIASARNPSELGTGLQQIAAGMSERRMAEKDQMFKNLMVQYELTMSKATLESEQLGNMTPETAMNLKRLEDAIEQLSGINLGQSQDDELLSMTSVTP
jgi:hypothetical protein